MIIFGFIKENLIKMIVFKNLSTLTLLVVFTFISQIPLQAQCENWNELANKDELEGAHSIYRGHVKSGDLDSALPFWKTAYEAAPAADGNRDTHYADGIKIYKHLIEKETDEAKKTAYKAKVLAMYDSVIKCFETGSIKMKKTAEEKVSFYKGRKALDMYTFQMPFDDQQIVLNDAVKTAGNNTEYSLLTPYAYISIYRFTENKLTPKEMRAINDEIIKIADHNIENNEKYKGQYEQAKDAALGIITPYENQIFDCAYFKQRVEPQYRDDPEDPENIKECIQILKRQGCAETDPLLVEIEKKWSKYAAAENAKIKQEFEANNPAMMAKKAKEEGDYAGAIVKYKEAIAQETDPSKQGLYYYQIGQISGLKQRNLREGVSNAKKAAELRPDWGEPIMLIGNIYIQNARKCGDAFKTKCAYIAAVDQYRKAKSLDPGVADKADEKIRKYNGTRPDKENAFMQGIKEGDTISLPCIGTSISLRF